MARAWARAARGSCLTIMRIVLIVYQAETPKGVVARVRDTELGGAWLFLNGISEGAKASSLFEGGAQSAMDAPELAARRG